MDRVLRFIAERPWSVLALAALLTALAVSQLVDLATGQPRLRIDPSTNRLLPEEGEDKLFYDYVRRLFGSDESMIVAITAEDAFTTETLRRLERMAQRFQALPKVHHVLSLSSAINLRGTEDGIEIGPFIREVPEDPAELATLRREALANPMYAGNLVSLDGRTVALVIYFLDFSDAEFIDSGIDAKIQQIAREEAGDAEVHLTGGPHIKVAQFEYQNRDIIRSVPLMLAAFALLLGLSFRTLRGVLIPLVTIVVALVWTLGIAATIGKPLNLVTVIVVPLFVILPLSYCVHVISEHYEQLRENPQASVSEAGYQGLRAVWLPVVFTGLTTGAGFFALILSPINAIRDFGVLSVGGIAATVLASLTLPPALMAAFGRPRRLDRGHGENESDGFTRFASALASFNLEHRRGIFIAAGLVVLAAAVLSTQIRVGAIGIRTFPADSRVRQDFEAVNSSLQGANLFNVIVQADQEGAFKEPSNLRRIEELQEWLEAQPEIGGTTSVVEYLKLCHRGFFANDEARLSLPATRRAVAQLRFFCASDDLEGFIDARDQTVNVVVRANVIDTELVSALTRRIEARVAELPEGLTATVTGNPILMNRLFDQIVRGQARSVLGAFVLIYLLLIVMFLDVRTAAKALVPNFIPVAFYFGALGASGVTLNFATSLIAPMVLGIAIDDTIHYFSRFTQDAKRLADEKQATIRALRTVGRPVTFTTVVLCVGFAVLVGSDLLTLVQFGALASATLAFAWVVDMTLTPALCSGLRIVTLWDTLTLDLGDDPQNSIPIFRGLSNAQSRIVAQMANMREIPAGQPLVRVGDKGDDMFVIIEGAVQAWAPAPDEPDGRRVINTHTRGDVVGEIGMFAGAVRTLNIDVVDDARLLRLTPRNLERLKRRHPRTCSTLLHNLNVIQAKRLQKQTERIR